MATKKISELDSAIRIGSDDLIPIVQNGETLKITHGKLVEEKITNRMKNVEQDIEDPDSYENAYSCYYIDTNFISKNIITIYAEERGTYTIGNGTDVAITHFDLYNKIGNKLSYSNSSVVINSGVSKVLVSANLSYWKTTQYAQCIMKVLKNGIVSASAYFESSADENSTQSVYLTPIIMDVQDGDVLQLAIESGSSAQPFVVLSNDIGRASLTVQAVA